MAEIRAGSRESTTPRVIVPGAVVHAWWRAAAVGGQIPGLWSRYAVECVCLVSFVKQSLNLCRSDMLSHGLLGCWILTQHRAMVAARCHGVQIQQINMCDFRRWYAHENLLCCVEMFV